MKNLFKKFFTRLLISIFTVGALLPVHFALAVDPPANLSVTNKTDTAIAVSWSRASDEVSYQVEISLNGNTYTTAAYITVSPELPDIYSYTFTSLLPNTPYWIAITSLPAFQEFGAVKMTSKLDAEYTLASKPTNFSASSATQTSITLQWSGNGASYLVQRLSPSSISPVANGVTTFTSTNLSCGETYAFTVKALNNSGQEGAWTDKINAGTSPCTPGIPVTVTAGNATATSIMVSWTDTATNESAFLIAKSTDSLNFDTPIVVGNSAALGGVNTGGVSYAFTNLAPKTTYWFKVAAQNTGGTSAYALGFNGVSTLALPSQLSSVSAIAESSSRIRVSWQGTAAQYLVTNVTNGTNSGWQAGASYTFVSLNCGTTYSFEIVGKDEQGTLTTPITASTATQACMPVPPLPPAPPVPSANPATLDPSCPALAGGNMVKVTGKSAIYALNRKLEVLFFPTGDEFKSWNEDDRYGGYIPITQACYDSLPLPRTYPAAVNYSPGSYVIKKAGTSQLYVVLPNNTIAKITPQTAMALYGANYKVMTVASIFWPHYVNTAVSVTDARPHVGMLVRYNSKVWYVDANDTLREVAAIGFEPNRFRTGFIHDVTNAMVQGYNIGSVIDREESGIASRIAL